MLVHQHTSFQTCFVRKLIHSEAWGVTYDTLTLPGFYLSLAVCLQCTRNILIDIIFKSEHSIFIIKEKLCKEKKLYLGCHLLNSFEKMQADWLNRCFVNQWPTKKYKSNKNSPLYLCSCLGHKQYRNQKINMTCRDFLMCHTSNANCRGVNAPLMPHLYLRTGPYQLHTWDPAISCGKQSRNGRLTYNPCPRPFITGTHLHLLYLWHPPR